MAASNTASTTDLARPFEKLGLKIGDPLHLESADQTSRYLVKLIGFLPSQSIIVTAPVVDGRQIILKKDRPFTIRSLANNNAFAFQSSVRAVNLQPYPYIHLDYPKEMLTIQVRNAARLEVSIPVRVESEFDSGTGEWPKEALIYDISKTGAGLRSVNLLGDDGDEIILNFVVTVAEVSKNFKVAAIIRNKNRLEDDYLPLKFSYGLQFKKLSEAARIVLSGFIYELQARAVSLISTKIFKLGILINPVAGLGGPAALKGSDGSDIIQLALAKGVEPQSTNKMESGLGKACKAKMTK